MFSEVVSDCSSKGLETKSRLAVLVNFEQNRAQHTFPRISIFSARIEAFFFIAFFPSPANSGLLARSRSKNLQ